MDLKDLIISEDSSIIDAIKQLDMNGKKILIILNNDKLKGVLTDGDIRRWILKNGDLNSPIANIVNTNPISLLYSRRSQAIELMKKHLIETIPLVDENNNLISVAFWNDEKEGKLNCFQKLNNSVVIMAGGKGTRLYPYTKILPKPLIPIGDTPIIERIVNNFCDFGCDNFYLTVNHKKNMIKSYFDDLEKSYKVNYVEEEKPLGTGGSLYLLKGKIKDTFFVSNCDILIEANYSNILKFHKEKKHKITMVTSLKQFTIPYGVITLNEKEKVERMIEKPKMNYLINTGMYIIESDVLNDIKDNEFLNLPDLFENYLNKGDNVGVYPVSENSWMDMGQLDEMEKMIKRVGNK